MLFAIAATVLSIIVLSVLLACVFVVIPLAIYDMRENRIDRQEDQWADQQYQVIEQQGWREDQEAARIDDPYTGETIRFDRTTQPLPPWEVQNVIGEIRWDVTK